MRFFLLSNITSKKNHVRAIITFPLTCICPGENLILTPELSPYFAILLYTYPLKIWVFQTRILKVFSERKYFKNYYIYLIMNMYNNIV